MARFGRRNPGREHLSGEDVTSKMQRQYEHILESLRKYRRQWSERRRKSVAAATVRGMAAGNPGAVADWLQSAGIATDEQSQAELLAEDFHGRPGRQTIDVTEYEAYDEHGTVLGILVGLEIVDEDGEYETPIEFDYDSAGGRDNILVVSNPAGTNIEFVGGDQDIDWQTVDGAGAEGKYLVYVGPVWAVSYFADKHHLSGPKAQKDGIEYRHEFGDDGGELPHLVFDARNRKLLLVGGEYHIEPEGVAD
jgi:hypothetical protein